MASTTFVNGIQPAVNAAWLNDVNTVAYGVLGNGTTVPTDAAQALANLGIANFNLVSVSSAGEVTLDVASISNSATLTGTTAGSVQSTMPLQGVFKKFVAFANGYENDTTTAQTITFPTAFVNPPVITTNTSSLTVTATTTTLTIVAPDVTTAYTGLIIVEGI